MKIKLVHGVTLEIPITEQMKKDYVECQNRKSEAGCDLCSLNFDLLDSAACEIPELKRYLEKETEL